MLQQMAKTLAAHRSGSGVLRRADHERPDGGDEQQDQDDEASSLWVPGQEFFKLKILAIHETKYELVGLSWCLLASRRRALPPDEAEFTVIRHHAPGPPDDGLFPEPEEDPLAPHLRGGDPLRRLAG
jgi:hypothetical protein